MLDIVGSNHDKRKPKKVKRENTKCNLHYNMSMKYAPKLLSNSEKGRRRRIREKHVAHQLSIEPIETSEVAHMLMLLPFLETEFTNMTHIVVSYMLVSPCK
jgi:hypothetical protein